MTYGLNRQADYRAGELRFEGFQAYFSVYRGDERLGEVRLDMPGSHNVQNALATIAACMEMDVPFDVVVRGIAGFAGVERRFTVRGEVESAIVVDDYGHPPLRFRPHWKERWRFRTGRLAVFQPHR